jgi:hypothetical protein
MSANIPNDPNAIQKFFTSRDNNANSATYVGQEQRLWYDPVTNAIYVSDGSTVGGVMVSGGGGGTANIAVYEQGNLLTLNVDSFDFVGNGVVTTTVGNSVTVTVNSSGAQGTTGSQGLDGTQGVDGTQGTTGSGAQGTTGTQGLDGTQGVDGTQGATGAGAQGTTGADGTQGTTGTTGAQGTDGSQGVQGTDGAQGTQGVFGGQGTTGTQGTDGAQGTTGNDGAQGVQGVDGTQGTTGTQGTDGAQGTTGAQGIQGVDGAQGTTGVDGAQGTTGADGTSVNIIGSVLTVGANPQVTLNAAFPTAGAGDGAIAEDTGDLWVYDGATWADVGQIQGPQGTTGTQGTTGPQGTQGVDGSQGATGNDGAQGTTGNDGAQGVQGVDGTQGTTGTQGTDGAQGTTGNDGAQGVQGVEGTQGTQGVQGATGAQGVQGTIGSFDGNLTANLDGQGYSISNVSFISATGNIGGDNINGNQLYIHTDGTDGVGLTVTQDYLSIYGNIIVGNSAISPNGYISAVGNISGNYIFGNGSQLTGINASGGVVQSATAPASPTNSTLWWDEVSGTLYVWYDDGVCTQWVAAAPSAGGTGSGSIIQSATAPADPTSSTLWWDEVSGTLYVWYDDGVCTQWVAAAPSAGSAGGGSIIQSATAPADPTSSTLWWDEVSGTLYVWYDDGVCTQWVAAAPSAGISTGNVTFNDQTVVGTGSQDGSGGLYLAPGTESVGNLQYIRVRGGDVATHIHLDTGNNAYFDQYFGDDGKYVKLVNTGNVVIGSNDAVGNSASWTFDTGGNLTFPTGNLVITSDDAAFGNSAVIASEDHNLITLSTGANGGLSSVWVEDIGNVGTSNIAAVYANPTSGSKIVRIAVGQNGGGGPNLWDFDASGNLTLPGNLLFGNGVISGTGNIFGGNLSLSGNTTPGNIITSGLISAAGNITAGNLSATNHTGTTLSVTGNVTGGNVIFGAGVVTGTGNIIGGNVLTGGLVTVTGNITGGNILTGGIISATGNLTAGNLSVTGNTATITTANYSIGYLNVPQISLASNVTAALTDSGKHYYSTTAGNLQLTLPDNGNVAFPIGTALSVVLQAAGNIIVTTQASTILYMGGNATSGSRVISTYGVATIMKVATNTWFINGTGVT